MSFSVNLFERTRGPTANKNCYYGNYPQLNLYLLFLLYFSLFENAAIKLRHTFQLVSALKYMFMGSLKERKQMKTRDFQIIWTVFDFAGTCNAQLQL